MILAAQDLVIPGRLAGATIAFRPGEVTAICGPNGAGKSSLLAGLAGLIQPGNGAVTLGEVELSTLDRRSRAQAIGYLPQQAEIAWDLAVETLVALGRAPWRAGSDADRQAIDAALGALDLDALRHRPASQLSGGELARALLARVLAGEPRWLLADEPLANLDLAHQLTLLARLRGLAQAGTGVVLVMHDLAQALNHADRVVVLDAGNVVADGSAAVALAETVIAQVWKVRARWLGEPGQRALAILP